MNGCMHHHCSSYGHNRSDTALSDSVLVMGTDTSELGNLLELFQLSSKFVRCEYGSLIRQI